MWISKCFLCVSRADCTTFLQTPVGQDASLLINMPQVSEENAAGPDTCWQTRSSSSLNSPDEAEVNAQRAVDAGAVDAQEHAVGDTRPAGVLSSAVETCLHHKTTKIYIYINILFMRFTFDLLHINCHHFITFDPPDCTVHGETSVAEEQYYILAILNER